ncbi:28S ribosomal protein S23, mitochondrial [Alligator sinensis]|uniref:Small ribosomal subunit protein mS23 n=1 Tax=Alligator sinensis TaxID=38654 RepID=A0A1U8DJP0_ALLSI|nr:28S ribosomal protein S23, mitochondrial [Alligator sinensis]
MSSLADGGRKPARPPPAAQVSRTPRCPPYGDLRGTKGEPPELPLAAAATCEACGKDEREMRWARARAGAWFVQCHADVQGTWREHVPGVEQQEDQSQGSHPCRPSWLAEDEITAAVFSRTTNLLRSGILRKPPVWYEVYVAFPPRREPLYRPSRRFFRQVKDVVPDIVYPEDTIRAKFYEVYGSGSRPFQLQQTNFKSCCQRFVEEYNELKKEGEIKEENLFEETGKLLLAKGMILRRKTAVNVIPAETAFTMTLPNMLKEQVHEEQQLESTEGQKENPLPS